MKCQDCEFFLAQNEISAAVEEHLLGCPECRALLEDLRANTLALDALRGEELPRLAVRIPRPRQVYAWAAVAAAAGFALAALLGPRSQQLNPAKSPAPRHVVAGQPVQPQLLPQAGATAKAEPVKLRSQKVEPLKIKMLTPDPDVVIYWLIED